MFLEYVFRSRMLTVIVICHTRRHRLVWGVMNAKASVERAFKRGRPRYYGSVTCRRTPHKQQVAPSNHRIQHSLFDYIVQHVSPLQYHYTDNNSVQFGSSLQSNIMSEQGLANDISDNAKRSKSLSGSPLGNPANPPGSGKHGVPAGQQPHQSNVAKKHDETPENSRIPEDTMTPAQNELVVECKACLPRRIVMGRSQNGMTSSSALQGWVP